MNLNVMPDPVDRDQDPPVSYGGQFEAEFDDFTVTGFYEFIVTFRDRSKSDIPPGDTVGGGAEITDHEAHDDDDNTVTVDGVTLTDIESEINAMLDDDGTSL